MFGELEDSEIYENNQGSDGFGIQPDGDDLQSGFVNSFDSDAFLQEDGLQSVASGSAQQQPGVLGAYDQSLSHVDDGLASSEQLELGQDPFSNSQKVGEMKPKSSSGILFVALLILLAVSAGGMFAYKKFFAPAPVEEQSMGDYFYDQASGGAAPSANTPGTTATVDVDLAVTPEPDKQVEPVVDAKPEAVTATVKEPAEVPAKLPKVEKTTSVLDKALAKQKADQEAMKKLVPDKSVMITVSNGGRLDPFLPYTDFQALKNKPKFDIIAPPMEIPEIDPVVDEVLQTKISGIMYEKNRPSAIVNFGDSDHLVHRGDVVKGLKIVDITKDSVVIKYGTNIYQATVGQTLDQGVNLNPVSNLSGQFGGAYSKTPKNVIQFNH